MREKEPTLLYLVYRPSEELFGFLSKRTADSLRRFRETEEKEANTVCFKLIYKSIVYYLHDIKGVGSTLRPDEVERVANAFSFRFCDQTEYSALLK